MNQFLLQVIKEDNNSELTECNNGQIDHNQPLLIFSKFSKRMQRVLETIEEMSTK